MARCSSRVPRIDHYSFDRRSRSHYSRSNQLRQRWNRRTHALIRSQHDSNLELDCPICYRSRDQVSPRFASCIELVILILYICSIVSVERVQEYISLTPEAPLEIPEKQPSPEWPQAGSIKFEHVAARYREGLDLVLKDVNFEIKAGEKIGVVGRTGAGKSSLTMVSFCFLLSVTLERLIG